jgi:glycosyl transferase family 25
MNKYIIIISVILILLIIFLFYKNKNEHIEIPDNNIYTTVDNLNDLGIYIINLKKDVYRKENMIKQLDKNNLKYEITEAVNGSELDIEKLKKENMIKVTESELKKGQYGCYLSHVNIWKKFLETDKKYCLVLEDDAILTDNFNKKINHMVYELNNLDLSIPINNIDMIYLNTIYSCTLSFKESDCKKTIDGPNIKNVRKPIYLGYNTCGYIITRKGAENLLKFSIPMTLPIDVLIHKLNYTNTLNIVKTINPYVEHDGSYSNTENIK